ncbi:MAG: sodium:solute symporter family protein [Calditrichaeota bacterium]|nr:sodium:solute symporter family protein [Calditrichota bacterium]
MQIAIRASVLDCATGIRADPLSGLRLLLDTWHLILHNIDLAILAAYLFFIIGLSLKASREERSTIEGFLVGGRRLTLPSLIATTVSTWYGGILGVGEYSYKYGLSNWLVFGVPYYLAAFIFALVIAGRASSSRLLTIPDQFRLSYGNGPAMVGASWVFVMTVPAAYILMLGVLINLIFGLSLAIGVVISAVVSTAYIAVGGFKSDVRTDWLQFVLMYVVFAIVVGLLIANYGGWEFLKANVPADHFRWHGGNSTGYIISWYFIALAALIEPSFYQRAFAARTPEVARRGIILSIPLWFLFDLMTTTAGLYARAILGPGRSGIDAFPLLGEAALPYGLKGLFLVGMVATIQSTVDSNSLLAASTLAHDLLGRWKRLAGRIDEVPLTRVGLALSAGLAVGIALWSESVVEIWHKLGSLGTPGLLLPLALSYNVRWKFRPVWAIHNMLAAPAVVGIWFLVRGTVAVPTFPFTIEPIFVGLGLSLLLLGGDHLTRPKQARSANSTPN